MNHEKFELNFDINEAPESIKNNILNKGYFYDLVDEEYIRNTEKENEIKRMNEVNELKQQIKELQLSDDEKDFVINILITDYVGGSIEKSDKDLLKSFKNRMNQVKQLQKELETK
ncbi:hypothetical protein MBCUT_06990 [Methanobrevibacter cuticularis]|uniref:Uncharacterized protein n=1 Tax=Methanobrevibacter cuticularis TaxID=47311 RepID=A0A166EHJ2_9EURY|nr:hypothetical protein [Methanobrevibacter cuticularis]KZX16661.1 hypothetical protein MBCUT_06990 [Methanobrevibacter cuticularis]